MPMITPDSADDVCAVSSVETKNETTPPSEALSWWAKVGLMGIFLSLLSPLVGLAGLWTAAGLGQLTALGLDTSRAKLPTVAMDPTWDLRVVYAAAVGILGVRLAMSALPRPTWKIAGLGPWGLWFVMGGVLWTTTATTLVLERHVVDLADGLHLVVFGGAAIWTSATAMWVIASVGYAALVGARIAARRSEIASGGVAVVGIAAMAVATPVLANPEVVDGADIYRDAPVFGPVREELEEAGNMLSANMADEQPPPSAEAEAPVGAGDSSDPDGMFASCLEAMVETRPGERASIQAAVTQMLSARVGWMARDEVEDVVREKMIDVCVDGRDRSRDELQGYLYAMSRKATVSRARKLGAQERYWSRNKCLIDRTDDEIEDLEEQQHRGVTVKRLMDELSAGNRALLSERYFDAVGYEEMAARRGKKVDSVRKATSRAREAFRALALAECR